MSSGHRGAVPYRLSHKFLSTRHILFYLRPPTWYLLPTSGLFFASQRAKSISSAKSVFDGLKVSFPQIYFRLPTSDLRLGIYFRLPTSELRPGFTSELRHKEPPLYRGTVICHLITIFVNDIICFPKNYRAMAKPSGQGGSLPTLFMKLVKISGQIKE